MRTLKLYINGSGLTLQNLYYNEFEINLSFHQYCELLYHFKRIKSHFESVINENIESVEILVDKDTILLLEKGKEFGRFVSEFYRLSNIFLSDPNNVLQVLPELMRIRSKQHNKEGKVSISRNK